MTASGDATDPRILLLASGILDVKMTSATGRELALTLMAVCRDPADVGDVIGGMVTTYGAVEFALISAAALTMLAQTLATLVEPVKQFANLDLPAIAAELLGRPSAT